MASGEMHTPRSYTGNSSQAKLSGHEWRYLIRMGSQPCLALSHTDLQGLMGSCWKSMVQIGAYMAQRKKSRSGLQCVPRRPSNCSMASMALAWVLWCRWLGILVMFQGKDLHMGMRTGSQAAARAPGTWSRQSAARLSSPARSNSSIPPGLPQTMIPAEWDTEQHCRGRREILSAVSSSCLEVDKIIWELLLPRQSHSFLGSNSPNGVQGASRSCAPAALAALSKRLSLRAQQHLFIPLPLAEASEFAHQSDERNTREREKEIKSTFS